VNDWDVPIGVYDVQPVEFGVFIFNSILLEGFFHIEWAAETFPDVAGTMFVELQVSA